MHHRYRTAVYEFYCKISVRNCIHTVWKYAGEAKFFSQELSVGVVCRTRQRTAAQREPVNSLQTVCESFPVTGEHLIVCQQMVSQCNRLRPLQMSITGHHCIGMFFRKLFQGVEQLGQTAVYGSCLLFQVKSDVYCDLVVTAAGRVEFLACLSDPFSEEGFYIHMYIFGLDGELHFACFYISKYFLQCLYYELRFFFGDYPLFSQHFSVSYAAGDIFLVQPLIEFDGCIEFISRGRGCF